MTSAVPEPPSTGAAALVFKNLLFTVLVPGTVAGWGPWLLTRGAPEAPLAWRLAALPLLAVGVAIYAWCLWDFATFGRGTPAPIDAPQRLVVRGLYRWTRNPMYVGVLATILGWTLYTRSPGLLLYGGLVWGMFQSFVVRYEEPHLRRAFGAEYDAYCAAVGRWWPRRR
ncbi:MAG: isoprenylcysteine carboxylmethyltransferase family protein [Candidatus Binatia bacterium]